MLMYVSHWSGAATARKLARGIIHKATAVVQPLSAGSAGKGGEGGAGLVYLKGILFARRETSSFRDCETITPEA